MSERNLLSEVPLGGAECGIVGADGQPKTLGEYTRVDLDALGTWLQAQGQAAQAQAERIQAEIERRDRRWRR